MRLAVISDIHGNWQAWQAVLRDMQSRRVDGLLCLGDIVGYGPRPAEVLEDVLSRCDNFVLGNHDAVIANRLDPEIFSDEARLAIEWTRKQLDSGAVDFFAGLPLEMEDEDILCVHSEAEDPERYDYIFDADEALPTFKATSARVVLVGHTHVPGVFVYDEETGLVTPRKAEDTILTPDRRYVVNVGSIGDSRDGNERACYCVLDRETYGVEFCRVEFDYEAYRRELVATGLKNVPYFLQVRDFKLKETQRLSDMDTRKLKSSQGAIRTRARAVQIHLDPDLLDQARRKQMAPPPREEMSTQAKVALGAAGAIAAILMGMLLAWVTFREDPEPIMEDGDVLFVQTDLPDLGQNGRGRQPVVPPPATQAVNTVNTVNAVPTPPPPATTGSTAPVQGTVGQTNVVPAATNVAAAKPVKPAPQPPVKPVPLAAADSIPAVLAYEGFEYPAGKLAKRDGGSGWKGAWADVDGIGGGEVTAGSLEQKGYEERGDVKGSRAGQNSDSRCGRKLDTSKGGVFERAGYLDGHRRLGKDGKTLFVSFLQRTEKKGKSWELEFHRGDLGGGGRISGIGNDRNGHNLWLRGARHHGKIGNADTKANFIVLRIAFKRGNDDVAVYVNPPPGASPPETPTFFKGGFLDMSFDGISFAAFMGKGAVEHDEIRIGRSYASVATPRDYVPAGIAALVCNREFRKAVAQLERRNPEHGELDVLRELAGKLTDVDATLLESFKRDAGKEIVVQLAGGSKRPLLINSVQGRSIRCTLEARGKRITKDLTLEGFHLQERLQRLGGTDASAPWVYNGLLAMDGGRPDIARQSFAKVAGNLGKALVVHVSGSVEELVLAELASALKKSGVPVKGDGIREVLDYLTENPPTPMIQRRLLGLVKRCRIGVQKRGVASSAVTAVFEEAEEILSGGGGLVGGHSPVAHWTMDELSGPVVRDKVASHHGQARGGVTRGAGISRGCLLFDGNGRVSFANTTGFRSDKAFTWTAWIKTEHEGSIMALTHRGDNWVKHARALMVSGNKLRLEVGHIDVKNSSSDVADGKWHHVAVTLSGGRNVVFYVDGKQSGKHALKAEAGIAPKDCVVKIGFTNKNYNPGGFKGAIDEVICYDVTLTPEEIRRLYLEKRSQ